ncbi:homogentisate 1,2-dioxygenase [Rhinocladiella mackenziei CBS 650.93]|uniref:homogentisate 1,2-dioxygenase n=1 Tax=Rhinocladiella mackenziei CBS 650.93 TaxID=1442369 RepID=A0A0D2GYS6_9EURO|nr:homogentisate 1,2-dioxygenase [Rhinocladiella mackenziei CBS 650.93]KIX03343.1 homogentisate 1,2-dioxygenase [Rhinocladiella mackenziei CBS 650.93]
MAPVTDFAIKDNYKYLEGWGSYHSSEAFPGANPAVNNNPQKPPYGLRTERISGSSFTAPRDHNLQTWMYRATSSLDHDEFVPYNTHSTPTLPSFLSPNSCVWLEVPVERDSDWTSQRLLARNGDPAAKNGLAIWLFSITQSMKPATVFSSLDGDCLIIPQAGALDIQTELGKLLVRQNEICVIPRGIRYCVSLPAGPCRGYICELFQGHFRLPDLGPVGSTGLANVRDFQIPTAHFDGSVEDGVAVANDTEYTVISRQAGRLWYCRQDHTPFDVAAWHGTNYPYKYDLARYCVLGNLLFDEHDPSLYAVLTAPSYREPGSTVVDFAIIPPRWMVAEDTFWLPYYHRNTMTEFYGPIVNAQSSSHPFNQGQEFKPFVAGLNGSMTAHGATEDEYERAANADLKPTKLMTDGITLFLLETEVPLCLSDWAAKAAQKNFKAKSKRASKM